VFVKAMCKLVLLKTSIVKLFISTERKSKQSLTLFLIFIICCSINMFLFCFYRYFLIN